MHELLRNGRIAVVGRHPYSSNSALVVDVSDGDARARAIYKPVAAERPLWDFPRGELARREVAAYAASEALGLGAVPVTVWREDAPHGPGSLQQWIEDATIADVDIVQEVEAGWIAVLDAELQDGTEVQVVHRDLPELRALALFDALVNNGDRKAGHLLRDLTGRLWVVDHGVTFHADPKLRTVLWGFEGQSIDEALSPMLEIDLTELHDVRAALDDVELEALRGRQAALRRQGVFPSPSRDWPAIPWPIY